MAKSPWKAATPLSPAAPQQVAHLQAGASTGRPDPTAGVPPRRVPRPAASRQAVMHLMPIGVIGGDEDSIPRNTTSLPGGYTVVEFTYCQDGSPVTGFWPVWDSAF